MNLLTVDFIINLGKEINLGVTKAKEDTMENKYSFVGGIKYFIGELKQLSADSCSLFRIVLVIGIMVFCIVLAVNCIV